MKAKKIITGIMIIGMTFGITGVSFAGQKAGFRNNGKQVSKAGNRQCRHVAAVQIDKRQDRQAERIYQGIKTGKITIREYKNLMREQSRIEQAEKRALRDGRITRREQEKLDWMQKRASEGIYEAKHNNRVARDNRYHSRHRY